MSDKCPTLEEQEAIGARFARHTNVRQFYQLSDKTEDKMAENPKISARLSADTVALLDAYAAALVISRSEAIERLINRGIENVDRVELLKNIVTQKFERFENRLIKLQIQNLKTANFAALLSANLLRKSGVTEEDIERIKSAAENKAIVELKNGQV